MSTEDTDIVFAGLGTVNILYAELDAKDKELQACHAVMETQNSALTNTLALIEGECPTLFHDGTDINYGLIAEALASYAKLKSFRP